MTIVEQESWLKWYNDDGLITDTNYYLPARPRWANLTDEERDTIRQLEVEQ